MFNIFIYAFAPKNCEFIVIINPPSQKTKKTIINIFPLSLSSEENDKVL
jgi:hypothetical protein